ncbi:hypothetical protein IWQ56_007500, partial [Coemansia nantahalensis]
GCHRAAPDASRRRGRRPAPRASQHRRDLHRRDRPPPLGLLDRRRVGNGGLACADAQGHRRSAHRHLWRRASGAVGPAGRRAGAAGRADAAPGRSAAQRQPAARRQRPGAPAPRRHPQRRAAGQGRQRPDPQDPGSRRPHRRVCVADPHPGRRHARRRAPPAADRRPDHARRHGRRHHEVPVAHLQAPSERDQGPVRPPPRVRWAHPGQRCLPGARRQLGPQPRHPRRRRAARVGAVLCPHARQRVAPARGPRQVDVWRSAQAHRQDHQPLAGRDAAPPRVAVCGPAGQRGHAPPPGPAGAPHH